MTFQLLVLAPTQTALFSALGASPAPPCSAELSVPSIPAQGTASLQAGDGAVCPSTCSSACLVGLHVPLVPEHTWLLWDIASISLESLGVAVFPLDVIGRAILL